MTVGIPFALNKLTRYIYDNPVHLVPELDGLRIVGNYSHEFLQRVPGNRLHHFRDKDLIAITKCGIKAICMVLGRARARQPNMSTILHHFIQLNTVNNKIKSNLLHLMLNCPGHLMARRELHFSFSISTILYIAILATADKICLNHAVIFDIW